MAEALSLNIAPQLIAALSGAPTLDAVQLLSVSVTAGPIAFMEPPRPLHINGTLVDASLTGKLTLRTAAGEISLQLAVPSKDTLEFLRAFVQGETKGSSKPLTLFVQTDNGRQAVLLAPKLEGAAKPENSTKPETTVPDAVRQTSLTETIPFTKGEKLVLTLLHEKSGFFSSGKPVHAPSPFLSLEAEKAVKTSFHLLQKNVEPFAPTQDRPNAPDSVVKPFVSEPAKTDQPVAVRIDEVLPSHKDWPAVTAKDAMKLVVTEKTHSGLLILEGDGRNFVLHQQRNVPLGTKLLLVPVPNEPIQESHSSLPLEREWPALRDMVEALAKADPAAARLFVQAKIPSPVSHMPGTALFFLAALQSGKIDEWLSQPVLSALVREGKRDSVRKIAQTIEDASGLARDARAGEWKSWPVPLHYGHSFEMLRLYVRRDDDGADANNLDASKKNTRFVITMNMSRLGAIQIDGLSKPKRLDLVLRSERTLPSHLPPSIRAGYLEMMEALGLAGTIHFQTGRDNWVAIRNERAAPSGFVL